MKAIHNFSRYVNMNRLLFSILQRYKMKAIHNLSLKIHAMGVLFSILQRYKMKAIHNSLLFAIFQVETVFNTSKIQNESNSQPGEVVDIAAIDCFQYFKDTK